MDKNNAIVSGVITRGCEFYYDDYYEFMITTRRTSGFIDEIPIVISYRDFDLLAIEIGRYINIIGSVFTHNENKGGKNRLRIGILAEGLIFVQPVVNDKNNISFEGYICKSPVLRQTPLGRTICDLMIAVNREYYVSDYIPTIVWGVKAEEAAKLDIGNKINIDGRFQSREYYKDGESKVAYEVSVMNFEKI